MADINRADEATPEIQAEIRKMLTYHPWGEKQRAAGEAVDLAIAAAVHVVVQNVPPSADRSVAIRKLREARMDCRSAITHEGKY